MAGAYQSPSGTGIGTLLRLIQDEKNNSPLAQPPASDVASPVREAVTSPILGSQNPGGTREVSLKPEGAGVTAPVMAASQAANPGDNAVNPVAPVAPAGPTPGAVVAPVRPVAPVAPAGPASAPAGPSVSASSKPTPAPSLPSIGTRISSSSHPSFVSNGSAQSVLSASTPSKSAPFKPIFGNGTIGAPKQAKFGEYNFGTHQSPSEMAPDLLGIAGEKLNPILGGLALSDLLTNFFGLGGFLRPKKAS